MQEGSRMPGLEKGKDVVAMMEVSTAGRFSRVLLIKFSFYNRNLLEEDQINALLTLANSYN